MMNKGLANDDVKISVLTVLKPLFCSASHSHGDIKEFFGNHVHVTQNLELIKPKIARERSG